MPAQLSNAAVEAVRLSHCHARRLGHDYIGTEHQLLGLIEAAPRDPGLHYVLQCFGISLDKAEEAMLRYVQPGTAPAKCHRPDTPRLRQVFQEAQLQATRMGDDLVRPRHLLLALVPASREEHEQNQSVAGVMLAELGLSFLDAKATITQELLRQERQSYALAMYED